MDSAKEDDAQELRRRLKGYSGGDIKFNELHFSQQLALREGDKEEVIKLLLNPEKLVYSYQEEGRHGDIVHCLHFRISNTRTMRLPVIFDRNGEKGLYILAYILRYRAWRNMVKKRGKW